MCGTGAHYNKYVLLLVNIFKNCLRQKFASHRTYQYQFSGLRRLPALPICRFLLFELPPTIYKFKSSILFAASLTNLKLHTPSRWPHSVLKHRTRNFFYAHSVAPIVRIMTLNTEFIKFTWKSPGHKQTLHHSKRHVRDIDVLASSDMAFKATHNYR